MFNIQRQSDFVFVIRPKLEAGQSGHDEWIELFITGNSATFSMKQSGKLQRLEEVTDTGACKPVGYEPNSKISYWFSYDRDRLVLQYGKGYVMEETLLMKHDFLSGKNEKDKKDIREKMQYLFSPTIRRKVQLYDTMSNEAMIAAIQKTASASSPALSKREAQSMIDIEGAVAFDKLPFVANWSPFIMDSSKANLFMLDSNDYTFSSSLPPACKELYSTVTAQDVDIDFSKPFSRDKYPLSNAIRHSIVTKGALLYEKLAAISGKYGSPKKTFLKVTMEQNHGNSLFYPYVMEIWPAKHGSPIHNHGNSYAIIRVIHGGLTVRFFNKHADSIKDEPLCSIDVKKGDCTWISPNWYQTHKLWNHSEDFCATLQCYQYGENDHTHWPYFDYVANTNGTDMIKEARGTSDFTFQTFHKLVMKEYTNHMDEFKTAEQEE